MDKVNKSLRLFSDTLEEWLECQKKWLYLENIFMAPDIQRQLPNETKLFANVDRQFKSIMRTTRDRAAALPVSETLDSFWSFAWHTFYSLASFGFLPLCSCLQEPTP